MDNEYKDPSAWESKAKRLEAMLEKAKQGLISASEFLTCMDELSKEKSNEQLALEEINRVLEELK